MQPIAPLTENKSFTSMKAIDEGGFDVARSGVFVFVFGNNVVKNVN